MDKELMLMNNLGANPSVSQRELSRMTGLSLGTINILINKMVREGLIKLQKIPADRVTYMLTPKGMEEKACKTRSYIQGHYQALENMRAKIRELLEELSPIRTSLVIAVEQPELKALFKQVLTEMKLGYVEATAANTTAGICISDYEAPSQRFFDLEWINVHDHITF